MEILPPNNSAIYGFDFGPEEESAMSWAFFRLSLNACVVSLGEGAVPLGPGVPGMGCWPLVSGNVLLILSENLVLPDPWQNRKPHDIKKTMI